MSDESNTPAPRRFVKYADKYYKVTINDKGLWLEPANIEEYMSACAERAVLNDNSILTEEDNILQKVIDEVRDELVTSLKRGLKETVLSSLGFNKDSWRSGTWEVDHCNSRMSNIGDLISRELKDIIQSEVGKDFILSEQERNELKAALRDDFVKQYKEHIGRRGYRAAEELATEHIKEYSKELLKNQKELIANKVLDDLLLNRNRKLIKSEP